MIKNWFKQSKTKQMITKQVSHTTQLQGFQAYTTVNLSDKKGDNVFSRE